MLVLHFLFYYHWKTNGELIKQFNKIIMLYKNDLLLFEKILPLF